MNGHPLPVSVDDVALARLLEPVSADATRALERQVELAWHLRQRDTPRALALAGAVEPLLGTKPTVERARLRLVRAEALMLAADPQRCVLAAQAAEQEFLQMQDLRGASDAAALLAEALRADGRFDESREAARNAHQRAASAADTERMDCALSVMADWYLEDFAQVSDRDWDTVMGALRGSAEPRVLMHVHSFWGGIHAQRSELMEAIAAYSLAYTHAIQIGQIRRAVMACTNNAACYSNLGAHDAALDWTERGLELARRAGWPINMGMCLRLLGNSLYLQGHLAAARRALEEGLEIMQPLGSSREHYLLQFYLVYVLLDQGEAQAVLERIGPMLAYTRQKALHELEANCLVAHAKALLALGRRREARDCAEQALSLAERQGTALRQIDALTVLADIHAPASPAGQPLRASLFHLNRVLALADGIKGYTPEVKTLEAAAREHALLGEHQQAYQLMRRAHAAHDQIVEHATSMRTLSEAARAGTQRSLAEATAMREKVAAHQARANVLQEANLTLERLAELGVAVTTHLGTDRIFESLYAHLLGLLKLQHLGVWLLDSTGRRLHLRYGLEQGRRLPAIDLPLHSDTSNAARCVREARELLHDSSSDSVDPRQMPGTLRTRTSLFGPLQVRSRVIGAVSIQSEDAAAYGERERHVFRSLCAWTAIALDNATVVEQLEAAHQQLLLANEAERKARERAESATQLKSDFMINMSHDLRTPLASLHGYLETLLLPPEHVGLADRARYLDATLAQSSKVDRMARELLELSQLESGVWQPQIVAFSLHELLADVVQKLSWAAARRTQQVFLDLPQALPDVMADPAMMERVFTNLLDNALRHTPPRTVVRVEADVGADGVAVAVVDTGPGLPRSIRDTVFKRAAVAQTHRPGGGGLGLLIVHQLLQQHRCTIRVAERGGFGAVFCFSLPQATASARERLD